ncbi:alpha/beta-hydrolase, partial [Ramicandelaber brevisporus]
SAGGNLSLALLLYLRDHGLPLPAGGFLLSPAMDLNCETDAWQRNTPYDYLRFPSRKDPYHAARLYTDPKARNWDEVQHIVNGPYVSPIKAESLQGLPHLLIQYGQCELLRDDIYNFSQRIINEVGPEKLQSEEYDDMIHVFHSFGSLKQTKDAYASFGKWASKLFGEGA